MTQLEYMPLLYFSAVVDLTSTRRLNGETYECALEQLQKCADGRPARGHEGGNGDDDDPPPPPATRLGLILSKASIVAAFVAAFVAVFVAAFVAALFSVTQTPLAVAHFGVAGVDLHCLSVSHMGGL